MTVILKNTTDSDIRVADLSGIGIVALGQRDVSEKFSLATLSRSANLLTYINDGTIVINDGTNDLSIEDGLNHIKEISSYEASQLEGDSEDNSLLWALTLGS